MTITTASDHPLFQAQLELEEEMRSMGISRFKEQVAKTKENGTEARTQSVRKLMGSKHEAMVAGIEEFMVEAKSGKAGRKHSAVKFFELVGDVDLLAHMTLRSVLDSVSTREVLLRAALNLSSLLEDEVHFQAMQDQTPTLYKAMHKRAKDATSARHRRNAMLIPARKNGVELDEWSPRDKLLVGSKLIEIMVARTGLAKITRVSEGRANTPIHVEATPETLAWIEDENQRTEWMSPVYLPTIIPPKPWSTPWDGGYHSGRVRRLTLVKTRSRGYLDELGNREMPTVYAAVNALQETPWVINERVLEVMQGLWDARSTLGKIPSQDEREDVLPAKPRWLVEGLTKEVMTEAQLAEFKTWKRDCSLAHEQLAKSKGKRIAFSRMLGVARRFKEQEAFYFPHQLDWRGRIYPVSLYLTPQGSDAQRGLLTFANTVPLADDDGVLWLAVHGAGLWGVDKVSMGARHDWVETHSADILASAENPYENRFWATAEKPWQALAFCFEWAGWKREGYAYESALPVQMDGTCNGLQNFSAILRDEVGGAAVNLVPADKPQDIYTTVAEVVARRVEADLSSEARVMLNRKDEEGKAIQVEGPWVRDLARGWHGNVTRKVTKRPVMTLAYGAREFGFKTQVYEDTVAPWMNDPEKSASFPFEGMAWEAAAYMGDLIWNSVAEVVVAAAAAMEWLQKAARVAAKEKQPVIWTTPTGFLVQQAYRVPNFKRIETTFEQIRIQISVALEEAKIDTRKQAAGISPNWVHSLDASHMALTIAKGHELGLRSFSFIHDSYGTHAGNAQVLATVLREEFVSMYQTDVLASFKSDLEDALGEGAELPPLPTMGNLDLNLVLESAFFFA
jgi:DNA-directed RNA polymerase